MPLLCHATDLRIALSGFNYDIIKLLRVSAQWHALSE